jgi:hypothetical protein
LSARDSNFILAVQTTKPVEASDLLERRKSPQ